jgi:hypothetical protein
MLNQENQIPEINTQISLRAIGLLAHYHAAGAYVPTAVVAKSFAEGRDAIRKALGELVDHGYVNVERYRVGSQWSTKYSLAVSTSDPPVGLSGPLIAI